MVVSGLLLAGPAYASNNDRNDYSSRDLARLVSSLLTSLGPSSCQSNSTAVAAIAHATRGVNINLVQAALSAISGSRSLCGRERDSVGFALDQIELAQRAQRDHDRNDRDDDRYGGGHHGGYGSPGGYGGPGYDKDCD